MKLWHKLSAAFGIVSSGAHADGAKKPPEHAVIVHFRYATKDLGPLFELEDALDEALVGTGVGEYDGNEMAADEQDCCLYLYGPDADRLYEIVAPVLRREAFMHGARVLKRYGPAGDGIKEVELQL